MYSTLDQFFSPSLADYFPVGVATATMGLATRRATEARTREARFTSFVGLNPTKAVGGKARVREVSGKASLDAVWEKAPPGISRN